MKTLITLGFTIAAFLVTPYAFGQNDTTNINTHSKSAENETYAISEGQHSLQSWHKTFHTTKARTIHVDKLSTGKTYDRHGDLVFPKGYGVQVAAFKNIRNLRKYLHMYEQKELYIQVVALDDFQKENIYRVILGADEDQRLIEREISLFNRAGVNAVLRKHKDAADTNTNADTEPNTDASASAMK